MKRRMYASLGLACLSLLVVAVLVGCSSGATTGGGTTTPPATTSGGTTGGSSATTGGGNSTPPAGTTGGTTGGGTATTGGGATTPPPAGSTGGTTSGSVATITEQNKAFGPASVVMKTGDTVTFANKDTVPHNVKINGKELGVQQPGESKTWTAPKDGSYPFSCVTHPSMTGQITVSGVVPTGGTGTGNARNRLVRV